MKTLLIRPFVVPAEGISPPLSIMYLSSYLKSKGVNVKIIDKCINKIFIKNISLDNPYIQSLILDIKAFNPDLIGMTLFSSEIKETAILCKLFKEEFKSALIVLGGPHPTAMPEETLMQIPECDFVTRGESELILYDLVAALSGNKDLHGVKGISFRLAGKNEIFHCQDGEIIADLDSLPFPDRESVIHHYRNGTYGYFLYGSPADIIMTSRGCPFQCKYCFKVCERYRSRSPENVLKEIDWIVKNVSPVYIQIMDDSFTIQRERCNKILDALIENNYPCSFKVRSRVNMVDEELLAKMKKAGVTTIVYGLESGSQKMLDAFNKKTTVEQNIRACELTRKAGLNCFADMILFYPGETRGTIRETMGFVKRAKPNAMRFHMFTPLPKTKAYEEAKLSGRLIGDWDITGQTPWVKLDEFDGLEEMEKITKNMFLRSMLNPGRILWVMTTFGKALIRNPILFVKTIIYNLLIKTKY